MALPARAPAPARPLLRRVLWPFVWQELQCCTLALSVVALLALSHLLPLAAWGVARYDFVLLGCLLMQGLLLLTRFETGREAGVIAVFHLLGFGLEVFKTAHGSWSYPEDALSKVAGVPLYAGFMYASVGSYMAQAWRRFHLTLTGLPGLRLQAALAGGAYLNFFTHHYGPDLRYVLTTLLLLAYRRTRVHFLIWTCDDSRESSEQSEWQKIRSCGDGRTSGVVADVRESEQDRMVQGAPFALPLPLAFALIGLFVYLAENAATALGAWVYPHQAQGWQPVHLAKVLAWTLLVVVAFLIVSGLKTWEGRRERA